MPEHSIEIIGQKLSYPSSWPGVAAVFIVCASIVAISFIFDEKRIGAIGDAVAGVQSALKDSDASNTKAQETIRNQTLEIESLTKALTELKKRIPSNTMLDPKMYEGLKDNREKTTESLRSYLSSQDALSKNREILRLECPECATVSNTTLTPELKMRLDVLVNQKQELEM